MFICTNSVLDNDSTIQQIVGLAGSGATFLILLLAVVLLITKVSRTVYRKRKGNTTEVSKDTRSPQTYRVSTRQEREQLTDDIVIISEDNLQQTPTSKRRLPSLPKSSDSNAGKVQVYDTCEHATQEVTLYTEIAKENTRKTTSEFCNNAYEDVTMSAEERPHLFLAEEGISYTNTRLMT